MAIAVFGTPTSGTSGASAAANVVVNVPTGTTTGHMMLATIGTSVGSSVAINTPSGWTLVTSGVQTTNIGEYVFVKAASSSEPASYTFALASGTARLSGTIVTYSGVDLNNPFAGLGTGNTSTASTSIAFPAATTKTQTVYPVLSMVTRNTTAVATTTAAPTGYATEVTNSTTATPFIGVTIFDQHTTINLPIVSVTPASATVNTSSTRVSTTLFLRPDISGATTPTIDAIVTSPNTASGGSLPAITTGYADTYVAYVGITASDTVLSITDTAGNTWSKVTSVLQGTSESEVWTAYASSAQSANVITITTNAATNFGAEVIAYAGAAPSAIGANTTVAATGAPSGSITTTGANSLVTSMVYSTGGTASAADTAQTLVQSISTSAGSAKIWAQIQNAVTASSGTSVTMNNTTSITYGMIVLEIKQLGSPPTIALNTPANAGTSSSLTPTLAFTGTDPNGDAVSYEVELDTVNTFNSTVPTVSATVAAWGAGGGGGGSASGTLTPSGGGGGGAFAGYTQSLTSGTGYTVTVGAGGSAGALGSGASTSGGNGGDSSFINSTTLLAKGGSGAVGVTSGPGTGGAGGASGSSVGTTVFAGGNGGNAVSNASGGAGGGSAGASGAGGNASTTTPGTAGAGGGVAGAAQDTVGSVPGAGAGGNNNSGSVGKVGGGGQVVIKVPQGLVSATGGAQTNDGTNDVWTFTSSGTWTPTFINQPLVDSLSSSGTGWSDITAGSGSSPYPSGDQIGYTLQSSLTNGTTYYWRARVKDPSGTNTFSAWSSTFSFTASSGTILTKTQTATSRIAVNFTKTQTTKARIATIVTKTQGATARIANTRTSTQPATSRIATSKTATQSSTARIARSITKTQVATSRISVILTKTQNATARIQRLLSLTQSATANITNVSVVTKTQSAIAHITSVVVKTQSSTARIANAVTKTQSATARIAITSPTGYAKVVIADTPVAYWRLDEASGTTANDQMGNLTGTYTGTGTQGVTGLLADDPNKAFKPNGSGGITAAVPSSVTGDFSAEFWFVRPANTSSVQLLGVNAGTPNFYQTFLFNLGGYSGGSANKIAFGYGQSASGFSALFGPTITLGKTYHLVGTYVASTQVWNLYVNGVFFSTRTTAVAPPYNQAGITTSIGFNSNGGVASSWFDGTIDDVALYNYALTPTQVASHYNAAQFSNHIQPAIARIANIRTSTQSSTARIQRFLTKTQSSVGRIALNFTRTQSSIARVANSPIKTQPATARITRVLIKTQSSVSRVAMNLTKIQAAVARITNTTVGTKTQPAIARIAVKITKSQGATARIVLPRSQTQSAVTRISKTFTKTQGATARIAIKSSATQSATAHIYQTIIIISPPIVVTVQQKSADIVSVQTTTAIVSATPQVVVSVSVEQSVSSITVQKTIADSITVSRPSPEAVIVQQENTTVNFSL